VEKVCILGLGYIGLPTACMLAENGYKVTGVDIDDDVITKLNNGTPHIDEPELENIFLKVFKAGNLKISRNVEKSDIYIISVPTPLNKNNKADLTYIISASEMIQDYVSIGNIIILESTSPPGTTRNLVGGIISKRTGLVAGEDFYLAYCPERVLPGKIIFELVNNKRVIGGINEKSAELAKKIYSSFVKAEIFTTTLETSEFVKLAENTYRDVNIALANEFAEICNEYNIDVWEMIKFANMHPRVNILNPGPGVGGHCIAVDPWFILENINKRDTLIEKCRKINNSRPFIISEKAFSIIKDIKNPKVTVFGVTYKENVGDIRESPALVIINELTKKGVDVFVYDPIAIGYKGKIYDFEEALQNSDLLLLFVGHDVFKKIDFRKITILMRNKNIFDTRNFFDKKSLKSLGFKYYGL